jgi:carboxypeptidase Taq
MAEQHHGTSAGALAELRHHFGIMTDLKQAMSLLGWDQYTYMPPGAAQARAQQLATLTKITHERLTNPRLGELIRELEQGKLVEGSEEAAVVRLARRSFDQATKLPGEFVEELSRHTSLANGVWVQAREAANFKQFAPSLEKLIALKLREADYLGFEAHPYDVLHDHYEPGSRVSTLRTVFAQLRDAIVPLVREVVARGRGVSDAPVRQRFDEARQEQFGIEVVRDFGYDFTRGRLDRTVHPFAQGMSKYDVRITTRYQKEFLNPALFGTLHEAGHAMYEQGIADEYQRTPLGEAVSLGVHESQSRMWENLVGRSYAFWQHAYERLQELFPEQLGDVPLDAFHGAVNRVAPSLIRVEADEVTYNLHIMIRFELELALLEGELKVSELPEAWNAKYQAYLGLTPPNDALGCLQDIHWAIGLLGYFPTYTLGNIMSVQLFEAAKRAHPGLEDEFTRGQFGTLLGWLRENVHTHGSRYEPAELLRRATGSELDAGPYIRYLNTKFRDIYGLS